jgi:hypothetical protein
LKNLDLEQEYIRILATLIRTGIVFQLPRSEKLGVIGINGQEYPAPTQEQLQEVFSSNHELIAWKNQQGFTQLQVTPIANSGLVLIDMVKAAISKLALREKILQTKLNSTDPDLVVEVNNRESIWIWDRVRRAVDTLQHVYFPKIYIEPNHQGFTKEEVILNSQLCAVPGWSVGLIEPAPIMPQPGQGRVIAGRTQLEGFFTPRDYLKTLATPPYQGETGWTLEDFLIHFITRLEATHQVSHDRFDNNALWLLGSFFPNVMPKAQIVMTGYWSREIGRKMYLSAHRTGNRFKFCAARSMVRLGI